MISFRVQGERKDRARRVQGKGEKQETHERRCPSISVILNERLFEIQRTRTMVLRSRGQQMASNLWNVSVNEKKSQYVWNKNIILCLIAMHQETHSFAALTRYFFLIHRNSWIKIVCAYFPWNNLYFLRMSNSLHSSRLARKSQNEEAFPVGYIGCNVLKPCCFSPF